VLDVVRAAVAAGAPAVQLRDKDASARELYETGLALLPLVRRAGALFFVNDRVDVALALGPDGVHVGPDDVPVAGVRAAVERARSTGRSGPATGDDGAEPRTATTGARRPSGDARPAPFLVGASADDPEVARRLVAEGADYIGCGTVYATSTKRNAGNVIGLDGLQRVAEAVDVPVVGIGGIDPGRSAEVVAKTDAAGVAVVGAVMRATDVPTVVRALLAPW